MRLGRVFCFLQTAVTLAGAVPTAPGEPAVRTDYDAIVVGGGPSGLSALSGLARVRRKALLIDSGSYRNGPTRHMHDVIAYDGIHSQSSMVYHFVIV